MSQATAARRARAAAMMAVMARMTDVVGGARTPSTVTASLDVMPLVVVMSGLGVMVGVTTGGVGVLGVLAPAGVSSTEVGGA
jgi:hypothetical protein